VTSASTIYFLFSPFIGTGTTGFWLCFSRFCGLFRSSLCDVWAMEVENTDHCTVFSWSDVVFPSYEEENGTVPHASS
jgi:hypothetical protein